MAPRPRQEIERLLAEATPADEPAPGERLVKLSSGEAPFPPSPQVVAAIRDLEPERLRAYPDSTAGDFCEAAAKLHGLAAENLLAGNGTDEVLAIIASAFVAPGGRAASPWPTYPRFGRLCEMAGAEYALVEWHDGWRLPAAELLALRAAVIYLANPNTPTGTAVPAEELAELAARFDGLLVIDEAYADFAEEDCLRLLADHANVAIVRSLSTGYALAGLRFGYALAHPDVVAALAKAKAPFNTGALAQAAAVAALADQDYAQRMWDHVRQERGRLTLELQLMGFTVAPSQASFVFARHPDFAEARAIHEKLRKQGVLVHHWTGGGVLADGLRISVGTSQENNALLAALEQVIRKPASE